MLDLFKWCGKKRECEMKVRFYATLRELTNAVEIDLVCGGEAKVRDVVALLVKRFGDAFAKEVFNEDGSLRVKILLNGRDIDFLKKLETEVSDKDTLHFFPPIGGG